MKRRYVVALHAGYWLMYLMLVTLVLALAARHTTPMRLTPIYVSPGGLLSTVPSVLTFYVSYSVLFPAFLARRRFVALGGAALAVAAAASVVGLALLYLLAGPIPSVFSLPIQVVAIGMMVALVALAHATVALVIRGFIGWYDDLRVKEDLLRKNHEVELALVRSRLDPHFLFNTLNNIDVLIARDPGRASTYLNELSDIMRFVLYGSRQELIPLSEELGFIEKYIRLEQIRVARAGVIVHEVHGNPDSLQIAPMSFIPFIENAFKHSAGQREDGTITSQVVIEGNRVRFECRNRYGARGSGKPVDGGLGNDLIRRRLELLYPGRHSITVSDRDHVYSVRLSLDVADPLHHR